MYHTVIIVIINMVIEIDSAYKKWLLKPLLTSYTTKQSISCSAMA